MGRCSSQKSSAPPRCEKRTSYAEIGRPEQTLNRLTRDSPCAPRRRRPPPAGLTGSSPPSPRPISWAVSRALVGPLAYWASHNRHGDMDAQILLETRHELAGLAGTFNHMVAGLCKKSVSASPAAARSIQVSSRGKEPSAGEAAHVKTVVFSDLAGFTRLCEGLTPWYSQTAISLSLQWRSARQGISTHR